MLNKLITIDQVMSWEPCYDREKILRLSRGKTEMTVGEILNLRFVPAKDKLWLLLREECVPARILHEFALWCAETALAEAKVTDERSWNALKVKRLWLDGNATDEELDVARYAALVASATVRTAWDTAKAAARDAARDAAMAAAMAAASDVAKYAARDTVSDAAIEAARDAAMAAAMAAAWDAQLAKLKEMLGGQAYVKQVNHH